VMVDQPTTEKALIVSQQLLQHISGMPTPLGTATAYHVFNQTRSKSLITLNNRLGQGITYDCLQRQLTAQSATIMQQVEEDGVYIPENMSHNCKTPHVFAMDNLDWKKTLEGGSFNATTAIIIENPEESTNQARREEGVRLSTSTSQRRKTLSDVPDTAVPPCHISAKDRQRSRSLDHIGNVESLETPSDHTAEELLLMWRLERMVTNSQLLDAPP
jgi:hypothetical protein